MQNDPTFPPAPHASVSGSSVPKEIRKSENIVLVGELAIRSSLRHTRFPHAADVEADAAEHADALAVTHARKTVLFDCARRKHNCLKEYANISTVHDFFVTCVCSQAATPSRPTVTLCATMKRCTTRWCGDLFLREWVKQAMK